MYSNSAARVLFVEEPESLVTRFRYESEGRSPPLEGVNSMLSKKTFPSIKIDNFTGEGRVVVSCITEHKPYR